MTTTNLWRCPFPPRERGWSPTPRSDHHEHRVSPARAGMVPFRASRPSRCRSFPRASGDGPSRRPRLMLCDVFPPRERGWSLDPAAVIGIRLVSPARAGMVPWQAPSGSQHPCFPRASGDGPLTRPRSAASMTFPPRERGWSLRRGQQHRQLRVSPARAGMVPRPSSALTSPARFPRASGDGPVIPAIVTRFLGFPPRERGWSQANRVSACHVQVSPARAGMVPLHPAGARHVLRFPRASGDGPHFLKVEPPATMFPPRERGWSPAQSPSSTLLPVSPARAGMVPSACRASAAARSFPRASGDGPVGQILDGGFLGFPPRERGWSRVVVAQRVPVAVSPARAGMVLAAGPAFRLRWCFPRASGDGPWFQARCSRSVRFPPRERGWSPIRPHRRLHGFVSPARAGMVPSHADLAWATMRFPRASGDGPKAAKQQEMAMAFPPRERGWSPAPARRGA